MSADGAERRWHIIEGEAGCRYAVEHGLVAVVVDALRASATAAMLLEAGAVEILVFRGVEEALAAKEKDPDALLFGERGGLPPPGFDHGNSPAEAPAAAGRRVIFTTTTGAQRLVLAWGAAALYMGSTTNARAVAQAAEQHRRGVVLIPAGLEGDPVFDAQEDRVAAVAIAMAAGKPLGQGQHIFQEWRPRIASEGIAGLFASAPHARNLRRIGKGDDVALCARMDLSQAVPAAEERKNGGVLLRNAVRPGHR